MTRQEFEEKVIAEAKSWIGVKFLHNGRSKRYGVDCLGLIAMIYRNIGVDCPDGDGNNYKLDWALHVENERYLDGILQNGIPITRDKLLIGDVVYFRVKSRFVTHGGVIISNTGDFVNSINHKGVIVENLRSRFWDSTYAGAMRLHNVIQLIGE